MKQLRFLFSFLLIASLAVMTSCGDDETPEPVTPDQCAAATFPTPTEAGGTATVSFLNFTTDANSDGIIEIQAQAGSVLSFAVSVTKGTTRPQKLRVYETDCPNVVGTLVEFPGQGFEDNDTRIDLRNTDDAQVRNVNYTVPTGMSPIYLNFAVDESGDKFTYKRAKITVSGSGVIDTYTGIALATQAHPTIASRLAATTGQSYTVCNAAGNIQYIDITYATSNASHTGGTTTGPFYFSSNPARYSAPISIPAATVPAACGDDASLSLSGGVSTKFKAYAGDFATATNADIENVDFTGTEPAYIQVANVGDVVAFETSNGRKGLLKIASGTLANTTTASILVDLKVQR